MNPKVHQLTTCLLLVSLGLIALFVSCNKDDSNAPSFEFIDQLVQGEINGSAWIIGSSSIEDFDSDEYFITFSSALVAEVCDYSGSGLEVFFRIPKNLGLYKLSFNLNTLEGQTVTFYDPGTSENLIATAGAIEILTITEDQVTGRIDARYNGGESYVNGNFTVRFCEEPVYEFLDRPLSGEISNAPWTPETEFAWEDSNYEGTVTIQMSSTFFPDPCSEWSVDGKNIAFRVGNEVGIYPIDELFLDQYYFYFIDSETSLWADAAGGAVEILSISDTEITGRMDVRYDSENNLNGNFSISHICE